MTSSLSRIPAGRRRSAAATLGLVAALLTAVGTVAATGASTASLEVFVALTLLLALVLAMVAWGLAYSVRIERGEQELDEAVMSVVRAQPGQLCSCGHEHDPTELHVTDAESSPDVCAHDGSGSVCAHDCDTCVLASLRPSPTATRSERLRS